MFRVGIFLFGILHPPKNIPRFCGGTMSRVFSIRGLGVI